MSEHIADPLFGDRQISAFAMSDEPVTGVHDKPDMSVHPPTFQPALTDGEVVAFTALKSALAEVARLSSELQSAQERAKTCLQRVAELSK